VTGPADPARPGPAWPGPVRASDSDRDAAADALADAVASGRLSLAEHQARLDALYAATTTDQVSAVTADLPARPAGRGAVFRAADPYRTVALAGRARRAGGFRIGRFHSVVAIAGRIDLDLRAARPSQEEVTLTVRAVAATVSVLVPAAWRIDDQVVVLGPRRAIEPRPAPGPVLHLRGLVLGGAFLLSGGA